MSDPAAGYRFIAWARRGLAAAPSAQAVDGRLQLPVTLTVRRGQPSSGDTEDVTRTLRLLGPGDVVGLDGKQIIRREPRPGTAGFEPNYFPLIEFDAPELPWLFSPELAEPRVRPWLALVVIRRELARISVDPRAPLPWVNLAPSDARDELPDLLESWAWAHAQIAGSSATPGEALDGRQPELTLSRLLCPRRLQPHQTYVACLVPAYRAGVQAGRGQPVEAGAELAWPPPGGWEALAGELELPLYDHWEFATGEVGDFELLVRRLHPHAVGPDIGALPLDISDPGPDFDDLALGSSAVLALEGALSSPVLPQRGWPVGVEAPFQQRLEELIEVPPGVDTTVLRPPSYGAFQAATPGELPGAGAGRPWMRELNLDPGWRAAAALGTRVVQELQEELVASAWDQAGELERANALLRQAQLARATAAATRDKHLDGLPADRAVRVTEPVHGRVRIAPDGTRPGPEVRRTLLASVKESVFPEAALSPPFRRALRPVGPLGRRLPGAPQQAASQMSGGLARGKLRVPVRPARGGADFDEVGGPSPEKPRFEHLRQHLGNGGGWQKVAATDPDAGGFYLGDDPYPTPTPLAPPPAPATALAGGAALAIGGWEIDESGRRADRLVGINNRFKQATDFLLQHLPIAVDAGASAGPELALDGVAGSLVSRGGALDPDHTVAREVISLVPPAPQDPAADPLRPRAATLRFPQPMSGPLVSIDRQLLLPGIERLPADSIGVLLGNSRFIEAYMVGLNHELSRELLWRGLPVDLAATFADRFWDIRGRAGQAGPPAPQLPPIAGWEGDLGANAAGVGGDGMLVLIVRGRLLLRYPHTAIYAVRAVPKLGADGQPVVGPDGAPVPAPGSEERYAELRGTIDPDVTYLGFRLTLEEARGEGSDLGWFFVIQEQPAAPRFGLDEPGGGPPAPAASWSDLDWAAIFPPGTDLAAVRHASIAGPLAAPPLTLPVLAGRAQPTATWGIDAAQMAAITYQRPMRVAIHARTALPGTGASP